MSVDANRVRGIGISMGKLDGVGLHAGGGGDVRSLPSIAKFFPRKSDVIPLVEIGREEPSKMDVGGTRPAAITSTCKFADVSSDFQQVDVRHYHQDNTPSTPTVPSPGTNIAGPRNKHSDAAEDLHPTVEAVTSFDTALTRGTAVTRDTYNEDIPSPSQWNPEFMQNLPAHLVQVLCITYYPHGRCIKC